jgi:excinuclease UvrABC nuclease subunit
MIDIDLPNHIIQGNNYNLFSKTMIYAWISENDEFLYIGVSKNGLGRLFNHHVVGKIASVSEKDKIAIWFFPDVTYKMARVIEADLINKYKPRYNFVRSGEMPKMIICPRCGKEFMQKRWWQNYCSRKCTTGKITIAP